MAEFAEVMRQAKRMCKAHDDCEECPFAVVFNRLDGVFCPISQMMLKHYEYAKNTEKIVMDWAEKHPEPRYPTWKEWQDTNFPNNDALMRPCIFESEEYFGCKQEIGCEKCINKPIPADIAEKLGIKPIGGETR